MENYYQRNMDQLDCGTRGKLSYNQLLNFYFHEESGPPADIITVQEVKDFSSIDIDEDDSLLQGLIYAAIRMCEDHTNMGFQPRTITATFNNGNGGFYLPYGPVTSDPTATDGDGNTITATYSGQQWMQVLEPRLDRMRCTYEAGYEVLPDNLKVALLNQVRYLYDNRAEGTSSISPIALMILNPLRRVW